MEQKRTPIPDVPAQPQLHGDERPNAEDDSIFDKTTWIPGGPVKRKPESTEQPEEDPGGHA